MCSPSAPKIEKPRQEPIITPPEEQVAKVDPKKKKKKDINGSSKMTIKKPVASVQTASSGSGLAINR